MPEPEEACEHQDVDCERVEGSSRTGYPLFQIKCTTCGTAPIGNTVYAMAPRGPLREMTDEEFEREFG